MIAIDVVIPAYRVKAQIADVVRQTLEHSTIRNIIVVDDACPEQSGHHVTTCFPSEPRVRILTHSCNQGVGGAVLSGYLRAFEDGADVVVKVDGDGQAPLARLDSLLAPILRGKADYTKGNRFFHPRDLLNMPTLRLIGNAGLSFINKAVTGYWSIVDPTNGFTALHRSAWQQLEPAKIARDYFFESDMLYQLGVARAVVLDVPTPVVYGDEQSSLRILRILKNFPPRYGLRLLKRFVYQYLLRDFSIASVETLLGLPLLIAGMVYGSLNWARHAATATTTPAGTVMITGLLILIGFQLLLSALNYDISHEPRTPLQQLLNPGSVAA